VYTTIRRSKSIFYCLFGQEFGRSNHEILATKVNKSSFTLTYHIRWNLTLDMVEANPQLFVDAFRNEVYQFCINSKNSIDGYDLGILALDQSMKKIHHKMRSANYNLLHNSF
jgi:hypothetical protein